MKLALAFLLATAMFAHASDWPQFLGPTRNGVYPGNDLAATWPKDGPPVLWQKSIGQGFSGPVVLTNKVIMFTRVNEQEIVACLDATNGKQLWKYAYPTAYVDDFGFDEGPRATPCVANGRVFTFGAEGVLTCLDFGTGKLNWTVDCKKEFGARKGFFGIACSPLVEGSAVLLNVGGTDGAGIVAFSQTMGKVLWKTSDDEASYSSPTAATIDGIRYALFFTRAGLAALDPATGKIQFQYPWRSPMEASVNSATPLVINDLIFLSASYDTGAILLRVTNNTVAKVWSADHLLSNHYATSVYKDGFLYGMDGRADPGMMPRPSLRCVEMLTGKLRWSEDNLGAATVTLAGNDLLILTEKGELIRAEASPTAFKSKARAQIMPFQVRAYPALANGYLFARSKDKLVCVDLGKPQN
jgi:outer membrane protein assembly factor BamB